MLGEDATMFRHSKLDIESDKLVEPYQGLQIHLCSPQRRSALTLIGPTLSALDGRLDLQDMVEFPRDLSSMSECNCAEMHAKRPLQAPMLHTQRPGASGP